MPIGLARRRLCPGGPMTGRPRTLPRLGISLAAGTGCGDLALCQIVAISDRNCAGLAIKGFDLPLGYPGIRGLPCFNKSHTGILG